MAQKKTQKLGPNQRKWLRALESGKFRQTRAGALKTVRGNYCCLGVACELFKTKTTKIITDPDDANRFRFNECGDSAPRYVIKAIGLRSSDGSPDDGSAALTELNDGGRTFKGIAKLIRADPANYFKAER